MHNNNNNPFVNLTEEIRNAVKEVSPSISEKKEWDALWGEQEVSDDQKQKRQIEQEYIANRFKRIFDNEDGRWVINYWKQKYLDQPTYTPAYGELAPVQAVWRDGQNHVPREVINFVIQANK